MYSSDNKQKKKKKRHGGLWAFMTALFMSGLTPVIMGAMLFIICAGTVVSVYIFEENKEEEEVIDLSLCPCGDCSQGYEYIGNTTTGNIGSSTSSTASGLIAAHGKKIADTLLNPYNLPLYDGTTMDPTTLGCESWTVEIANNSDPVVQQAANKNTHSYMYHLQTIGGSPYADASNQTQIRIVDGRLCVAVGKGVYQKPGTNENGDNSNVMLGRYLDVIQKDGTVIACIIGDVKDTGDTSDAQDIVHKDDSSIVEFQTNDKRGDGYVLTNAFFKSVGKSPGNYNFVPGLNSVIDKIVVYDVKHYTKEQGYKAWFTDNLKLQSSGSSISKGLVDTAVNIAQQASGNTLNSGIVTNKIVDTIVSGGLNLPSDINTLNTQDSDLVGADNIEKIWNYFKSKGFTDYAVAGILGNMKQESAGSFDPGQKEIGKENADQADKPGGYGLIQWTNSGGADRKKLLFEYLEGRGLPKNSLAGQLDYIIVEHVTKNVWISEGNTDLATKSGFKIYAAYNFDSVERATYEFLYLAERPKWTRNYSSFEEARDSSNFKVRSSAANTYYSRFTGKTPNNSTGGNAVPIGGGGNKTKVKTNVKLNFSAANVDVDNWDGNVPKEYEITSCDPITINQHLLPDKNSNPQSGNINSFIVHYWGRQSPQNREVSGDNLYSGWATSGVQTSATFSMGTAGDIWQYVPLNRAPNASNTNQGTLAIEVADRIAGGQYTEAEYKALVHLAAWICYTYNLDTDFNWQANPRTNNMYWDYSPLRRHYDTLKSGAFRGKPCPAYWVPGDGGSESPQYEVAGGNLRWIAFKQDVTNFLVEYKDDPNFAPTNVNELAGYQESLGLVDKSRVPNWADGQVIYETVGGNGDLSSNLADYRGKGCGCKIPCPDCTCHDADAEQIRNNIQIGGITSGNGSETTPGGSGTGGTMSDSDGVAIQGGAHLGSGGEGKYYTIENNILTFKGDSWSSTTFMKNVRTVMQYYIASGHMYVQEEREVPGLGICRMDCSGMMVAALNYSGYSINSDDIWSGSDLNSIFGFQRIAWADMQPGDIVRYDGHITIFCGWIPGQEGGQQFLAYNWGDDKDASSYGAYAEPKKYGPSKHAFLTAYRPVPPS